MDEQVPNAFGVNSMYTALACVRMCVEWVGMLGSKGASVGWRCQPKGNDWDIR